MKAASMLLLGALALSPAARAESDDWALEHPEDAETLTLAVGAGANATTSGTGWQGTLALMGENRALSLLTQVGLGVETVGARRPQDSGPTGRLTQLSLSPFTVYGGVGALRVGAGWEVSYGLASVGPGASDAEGRFGLGGRVGGGLSLHPGPVDLWLLGHYRWLGGERVGGWFVDLFLGLP